MIGNVTHAQPSERRDPQPDVGNWHAGCGKVDPNTFHSGRIARFGRCEVRVASREVWVDGLRRPMQPRPFDLLVYLIEQRHRVVPIDELLDEIWRDACVQPGSLAAAVLRVRRALDEPEVGFGEIIRTHQRVGYRFVAPLEAVPACD